MQKEIQERERYIYIDIYDTTWPRDVYCCYALHGFLLPTSSGKFETFSSILATVAGDVRMAISSLCQIEAQSRFLWDVSKENDVPRTCCSNMDPSNCTSSSSFLGSLIWMITCCSGLLAPNLRNGLMQVKVPVWYKWVHRHGVAACVFSGYHASGHQEPEHNQNLSALALVFRR